MLTADWYRYNLKHKVVELPPVSEEQFVFRMCNSANDHKQKQRAHKEQIKKAGIKTLLKLQEEQGYAAEEDVDWETDSETNIVSDEKAIEEEQEEDDEDDENTISVFETGELVLTPLSPSQGAAPTGLTGAGVTPRAGSTALSTAFAANFLKKRNNIAGGMSIVEAKPKNFWHEKNSSRLDTRSHKLQKNPNCRAVVTD
ncbi:hypothetical protein P3T76_002301 [Phytophthora citrophthora]|uniref:Uncharacterized protein n=1 Tax=Phytophthora citrophthora TaxID=4793 RepID=A0AAD9LU39_9STRA|nr:hypothetical protein P3T76_002301 [Phytophthora citrophthora]